MIVTLRSVTMRTSEFGLQQNGAPIPVDVEVGEDEKIVAVVSGNETAGFNEVAQRTTFWIMKTNDPG